MSATSDIDRPITDYPVYWFARLEQAVERRDRRLAAEARERLRQLGVDVRWPIGRPRKAVAHAR